MAALLVILATLFMTGCLNYPYGKYPGTMQPMASQGVLPPTGVVESQIEGDFEGWSGNTVFPLANGQVWQQVSYAYTYHYAFQPKVLIYPASGTWMMKVEGVSEPIGVKRIR